MPELPGPAAAGAPDVQSPLVEFRSMRVPNAIHAVVEDAKLTDYLLSETHEEGRGKSQFFNQFGFTLHNAELLRSALVNLVQNNDVLDLQLSLFGAKYVVEGPLLAPDGRKPLVRSVWIVDVGKTAPRLVTAYPAERPTP